MSETVDLSSGLKTAGQFPLDFKTYFNTLSELQDLGPSNFKAFYYYDGMEVYCLETNKKYNWKESNSNTGTGVLATDFVYPENTIACGITYDNRAFNFFEQQNSTTIDQNNLILSINVTDKNSITDVLNEVNSLTTFNVDEKQIFVIETSIGGVVTKLISKVGKGTYGNLGTTLTESDFVAVSDNRGQFLSVNNIDDLKALPVGVIPNGKLCHVKKFRDNDPSYINNLYIFKDAVESGDLKDNYGYGFDTNDGRVAILIGRENSNCLSFGVNSSSAGFRLFSSDAGKAFRENTSLFPNRVVRGAYVEENKVTLSKSFKLTFDTDTTVQGQIPLGETTFISITPDDNANRLLYIYGNPTIRAIGSGGNNNVNVAILVDSPYTGVINLWDLIGDGGLFFKGNTFEEVIVNANNIKTQRGSVAMIHNSGKKLKLKANEIELLNNVNVGNYEAIRNGSNGIMYVTAKTISANNGNVIYCESNTTTYITAEVIEAKTAGQKTIVAEANAIVYIDCKIILGSLDLHKQAEVHFFNNPRIITTEAQWLYGTVPALRVHGTIYPNVPAPASTKYGNIEIIA